jgi:hypothetical protein
MADDIKNRDNRDADESGRPVQLDREKDDKVQHQDKDKQHDKPAGEQAEKPGQHQNR